MLLLVMIIKIKLLAADSALLVGSAPLLLVGDCYVLIIFR